jgi:Ca2+-binding EF-hand superfamily protein
VVVASAWRSSFFLRVPQRTADKDGDLGLRELLEIQKLEGDIHKSVLTPSLLFRFDGDQDGSLDVRDFDKLMKHLRKEKGKRGDLPKAAAPPGEEVWSVMDQRRASLMNFSRDGDTPLITGQGQETAETAELLHAVEQAERREAEEKKLRAEAAAVPAAGSSPVRKQSGSQNGAVTVASGGANGRANGEKEKNGSGSSTSSSSSSSSDEDEDPRAQATPARGLRSPMADEKSEKEEEEEEEEEEDENSSSNVGPSESADQEATAQEDDAQQATALAEEAALTQIPEALVEDDDDAAPALALSGTGSVGGGSGGSGATSPVRVGTVSPNSASAADTDSAKIIEESQHNLMEILSTPAGKKKYMKWLFRLADAENKGRVNVEELSMILRALAMDGLALSELSFEAKDDNTTDYMDIARRIMGEFDTGKDGVLSEQEFHVLADLIVRKYAARTSEDKVVLERYRIKRILGHGAMGVVKLATNLKSGKQVAIKIIDSAHVSDFSKVDVEIKAILLLLFLCYFLTLFF